MGKGIAYNFGGCILWLDAGTVDKNLNLARVPEWIDKVNNIKYANGSVGGQGILYLKDPAFDYNPAVAFLYSQYTIASGQPLQPFRKKNRTTILVFKKMDSPNYNNTQHIRIISSVAPGFTGGHLSLGASVQSSNDLLAVGCYGGVGGGTAEYTYPTPDGNANILAISDLTWILNGDQLSMTGTTYTDFNINLVGSSLGSCAIAEILQFDRNFTLSELKIISNTINLKYKIY